MPPLIVGSGQSQLDESDRMSVYSMNSNPFYGGGAAGAAGGGQNYQQKFLKDQQDKKQLEMKKDEQINEWGFQNEESKKIFEARWKKKNDMKSKGKKLTASEKYEKLMMQNGKR